MMENSESHASVLSTAFRRVKIHLHTMWPEKQLGSINEVNIAVFKLISQLQLHYFIQNAK